MQFYIYVYICLVTAGFQICTWQSFSH